MQFFVSLLSVLTPAVVGVMGASIGNIPVDVDKEYPKLLKLCQDAGAKSVSSSHTILPITNLYISQYVGVLYQNDEYKTYNFGDCYPYQLSNGNLAEMAVFCKTTTCNSNPWALIVSKVWRTALLIACLQKLGLHWRSGSSRPRPRAGGINIDKRCRLCEINWEGCDMPEVRPQLIVRHSIFGSRLLLASG